MQLTWMESQISATFEVQSQEALPRFQSPEQSLGHPLAVAPGVQSKEPHVASKGFETQMFRWPNFFNINFHVKKGPSTAY